jgi:hypothetical protein
MPRTPLTWDANEETQLQRNYMTTYMIYMVYDDMFKNMKKRSSTSPMGYSPHAIWRTLYTGK